MNHALLIRKQYSLLMVAGIGGVNIAPLAILTHVLHVLKLFISLVLLQKLEKLNEYMIVFYDIDAFLCNKVHPWDWTC